MGSFIGGFVGGVIGGALGGAMQQQRRYGSGGQHRQGGNVGGGASQPSAADSSNALASLAPPTTAEQLLVLKAVKPITALGSVGMTDDLQRAGQQDNEEDRNYTDKVAELVAQLNRRTETNGSGGKTTASSDITQHGVLEALDNAIRNSQLVKFERFRDESWSPERLRVMIIERLKVELGDALQPGKHDNLTMHDVEVDIAKAVKNVQTRLFETSELLAANRNSTEFLLRLYQAHGDVSSNTREHTEQVLRSAANEGVAPFAALFQRDPNGYALHYRGERIIYDCLTENVDAITSSQNGVAADTEIEQRILDTNRNVCSKWVADQLTTKDGQLKPQEPQPLRAVWSSDGLHADPQLLTRAPDEL